MKLYPRLLLFSLTLLFSCSQEEPTLEPIKYTLTVSAGTGGSVSTTGGSYEAGASVSVTATPNAEFEFTGWSNGSTDNPLSVTVNSNTTITANFAKVKYALNVTIEGEGTVTEEVVSTGKDYDSGTVVQYTAVPAEGWIFSNWSGAEDSIESSITLTADASKSITATFIEIPFETASVGEGTIQTELVYNESNEATALKLTAVTPAGWRFDGWTGGVESTEMEVEVALDLAEAVTATFIQVYDLTVTIEGEGEVTEEIVVEEAGKTYDTGTNVKLTAVPAEGWRFDKWTGAIESSEIEVTLTVDEAKEVTATFIKIYDLTVNTVGEGTITEEIVTTTGKTTSYDTGVTVQLTAEPAEGWRFEGWAGAVESTESVVQVVMSEAREITATFIAIDSDNDGVLDINDLCSDTVAGSQVNIYGCINPIFLDENGITVKAYEWSSDGDIGILNDIEYIVVNRESLEQLIIDKKDLSKVVTSKIQDMSSLFTDNIDFNQNISSWDTSNVTSMENMFQNATSFNQNLNYWDVSNVINFERMFASATSFNQPLDLWDTSKATKLSAIFYGAESFNQNINSWNTSNVTGMTSVFNGAINYNQPLNNWDTSNVIGMSFMFRNAKSFNQNINDWNTSRLNSIQGMFDGAISFNSPLNNWNTQNLTIADWAFRNAISFNQDLDNWDTSDLLQQTGMFMNAKSFNGKLDGWKFRAWGSLQSFFEGAESFNQDISSWDVRYIISFDSMFKNATSFNMPLENWVLNVQQIINMNSMFENAVSFNQPLNTWNVSKVRGFSGMFMGAISFNQPLDLWDVGGSNLSYMFEGAESFDSPIFETYQKVVDGGVVTHILTGMFKDAKSFNHPIKLGYDYGGDLTSFLHNAESFNSDLILATNSSTNFTDFMNGCKNFTLDSEQKKDRFRLLLRESNNRFIRNGDIILDRAFANITNLGVIDEISPSGYDYTWNLNDSTSQVISMQGIFSNTNFNWYKIAEWDTSKITNMKEAFKNNSLINLDLSNWDVSNVIYCEGFDFGANSWSLPKPSFVNCVN